MEAYASTFFNFTVNVLVTGATGFIGQRLCLRLREAGHNIRAFSRSGSGLEDTKATFRLDLANEDLPSESLQGVDCVYHLAGIAHRQGRGLPYGPVNYEATVKLALLAESSGVRRFVFLSSVKAMGRTATGACRSEEDCTVPEDAYGLSKWMAEEALRHKFSESSMAVYIIRPALVYGPRARGNLQLMARMVAMGLPRPPGLGGRSMVSRDDLVALMLQAGREGPPGVHTWIATDGEVYSARRIYDAMRISAGKSPGVAWCPEWAWRLAARIADSLGRSVETHWEKVFGTEVYSAERVRLETGWTPEQTLEQVFSAQGMTRH